MFILFNYIVQEFGLDFLLSLMLGVLDVRYMHVDYIYSIFIGNDHVARGRYIFVVMRQGSLLDKVLYLFP